MPSPAPPPFPLHRASSCASSECCPTPIRCYTTPSLHSRGIDLLPPANPPSLEHLNDILEIMLNVDLHLLNLILVVQNFRLQKVCTTTLLSLVVNYVLHTWKFVLHSKKIFNLFKYHLIPCKPIAEVDRRPTKFSLTKSHHALGASFWQCVSCTFVQSVLQDSEATLNAEG
jgi:hypothetical protein